jgi:hypothetical protein
MNDSASRARGQRRGSRLRRDGCIVAGFLCLATFAAACGGSHDSSSGAPRSPLAFAKCMRAHGLPNFPDPNSNGQFNLAGINQNSPQAQRAFQACGSSGANTDPGQRSQWMAQGLRFSRCMRAHGVPNFPDPNPNGQNSVQVNHQTPLFQRALTACRPLLTGSSSGGSTP